MIIKLEEAGTLFIPESYIQELRWRENDNIGVVLKNNELVLKKLTPSCVFCDAAGRLVKIGKFCVCRICIENLHNAKDGGFLYSIRRG
jgi:transcriptional pleiotropic regulator of transition state genes